MNLWDRIKQELEAKLGPANYQKWIRRTAFARLEGGTLFVNVADEAARKWIETEYAAEVLAIARQVDPAIDRVEYELNPMASTFNETSTADVYDSRDRKSTRLNSSHRCHSYAVFCLKKNVRVKMRKAGASGASAVGQGPVAGMTGGVVAHGNDYIVIFFSMDQNHSPFIAFPIRSSFFN